MATSFSYFCETISYHYNMKKLLTFALLLCVSIAVSAQFIYNPAPMAQKMFENTQFIYTPTNNVGTVQSAPAPSPSQTQNSATNNSYENTKRDNLNRTAGELCPSCKGSGKCHACNGTKVAHSYGNAYQCNVCDHNGNCSVCHGTGKAAWNR